MGSGLGFDTGASSSFKQSYGNKAILDKILAKRELITELKAQGATDKEIIEILKNV